MINHTSQRGFTLLETLIAIGITGFIAVAAASLLMGILKAERHNSAIRQVETEANYALYQITQSVRNASAVSSPATGVSGTTATFALAGVSGQNPTIVALSGTTITLKQGGATALAITSPSVQVSDFSITNVTASGTKGAVRISFTVSNTNPAGSPDLTYSRKYYTTVTLR